MIHPRLSRGFTLIELLVVIAIIGILSSVLVSSLSIARAKTRDATRLSDFRQIQTALETYRNEKLSYPSTSGSWWGNCGGFGTHPTSGATGWVPNLAPTYIAKLPVDPKPIVPNNCYVYKSTGDDYMLIAYGTVETKTPATNPAPRPAQPTEADFAFYTPGARDW